MILVAPVSAQDELSARLGALCADLSQIQVITAGSILKGGVTEWVGVTEPDGGDDLPVNLKAPEANGRPPSVEWGYSHGPRWSRDAEGADGCFNHTDLIAASIP